ncbi:hypothetical protein ACFKIB_001104 [Campylobacter upsaliensis]
MNLYRLTRLTGRGKGVRVWKNRLLALVRCKLGLFTCEKKGGGGGSLLLNKFKKAKFGKAVSLWAGAPLGFLLQTRCVFVPRGANATP